jgi:hypothetical protein
VLDRLGEQGRLDWSRASVGFIHAAVDDHSRLAYAEIHPDETGQTAAGFVQRAQAWFADHGVGVQRVLTDIQSGWCLWRLVRSARRGHALRDRRPSAVVA